MLGWMLVGLVVLAYLVLLVLVLRAVRLWWRDRFRRRKRKGKWEIRCDASQQTVVWYGVIRKRSVEPCNRLAHYMLLDSRKAWGTTEKRCWRHHRKGLRVVVNGERQVFMKVNRKTAWVEDPPPRESNG